MAVRLIATLVALSLAPAVTIAQSNRFALAAGQALPTKAKFGLFPTLRAEWYLTAPTRTVGLLADAYVARAFPSASAIGEIGRRWFRGTEYGGALSVVLHPGPHHTVSPYLVLGVLARVSSARDSTSTPPAYGVSWGTDSAIEPNLGVGARLRLASGHDLRIELRYYDGLVFMPLTAGFTL